MTVLADSLVSAQELITRALKVRKALSPNETLGANDAGDAFVSLNAMMKTWGAQRWMVHQILQEPFNLVADDGTYTIGLDADFNTNRPIRLVEGSFTRLNNIDSPLRILERDQYDSIMDKTTPGVPYAIFCDMAFPLATIKLHFVPESSSRDLYLNSLKPLERFSSLTGTVNLPPEYEEMLVYNLAKRLTQFGGRMDQEDIEIANEGLITVFSVTVRRYEDSYFMPGER